MAEEDFVEDLTETASWSVSSSSGGDDDDDDGELQSMTAKGVKHLCSELLELKRESDEDFQKNVHANYLSFSGISNGVKSMENELMRMKFKASTQKRLIRDLADKIFLHDLQENTLQLTPEETSVIPSPSKLEVHTEDISEILDTLLFEHRVDETLCVLENEAEYIRGVQLEGGVYSEAIMAYNSAISERRGMLAGQLVLIAENPRVSAPELQKALVGLCQLGETHLATQLLLKFYHTRVASGLRNVQSSKVFVHGLQIQDVTKYTFSMISQAVRSYVGLHGENATYPSELIQWTTEETELFATYFTNYVKSESETSSGLSTIVEAVHCAMSYCSLLETQRIIILPYLIKHIRPCMEEILQIHVNHYKNVLRIFSSSDTWTLEEYHISGILTKGCSSSATAQRPEYCLLTDSGWKFITLLQAIAEDVSPLVSLHMESSVLKGLMDIFTQYIIILEGALVNDVTAGGITNILLVERVLILANLTTVTKLFSCIIEDIGGGFFNVRHEVDSYELFTQEICGQLRAQYCQQFIRRFLSPESDNKNVLHSCTGFQDNPNACNLEPSSCYQDFFLDLRKLQKLSEDNHVEVHWLEDLLRELVEAILLCISSDKETLVIDEELSVDQHRINFMQFVLNIEFLVEIARRGGYISKNITNASLEIMSHAEAVYASAGLNSKRHITDDGWAAAAASKALQKLQDQEMREIFEPQNTCKLEDGVGDPEQEYFSSTSDYESSTVSADEASEFADNTRRKILEGNMDDKAESLEHGSLEGSADHSTKIGQHMEVDRYESKSRTHENVLQKSNSPEKCREDSEISDGTQQLIFDQGELADKSDI